MSTVSSFQNAFTKQINLSKQQLDRGIESIYSQDVFRQLIRRLEHPNPAHEQQNREKLEKLFSMYGIDTSVSGSERMPKGGLRKRTAQEYWELLEQNRDKIPTETEFMMMFSDQILKLYQCYRNPCAYMKRLVEMLADPNLGGGTVRVVILKHFLRNTDYLRATPYESREPAAGEKKDGGQTIREIVEQEYGGRIEAIDDEIFEKHMGTSRFVPAQKDIEHLIFCYGDLLYEPGETDGVLTSLLQEFDPDTPYELEARNALHQIYALCDRKQNRILEMEPDLLERLRDHLAQRLKQFKELQAEKRKNLASDDCKGRKDLQIQAAAVNYSEELRAALEGKEDEAVFCALVSELLSEPVYGAAEGLSRLAEQQEQLGAAMAESKEAAQKGTKLWKLLEKHIGEYKKMLRGVKAEYDRRTDNSRVTRCDKCSGLLQMCDDFEKGRFLSTAKMKERLYYFAVAFRMTVSTRFDLVEDHTRDIQKNLFQDYYCNNVTRYLETSYQRGGVADDLTEVGINYSNFVEVVYLYWLYQPADRVKQEDKIASAKEMIDTIVKKYKQAVKKLAKAENGKESANQEKLRRIAAPKADRTLRCRGFFQNLPDGGFDAGISSMQNHLTDSPEAFMEFILTNYNIDPNLNYHTEKAFTGETYRHFATDELIAMLSHLLESTNGELYIDLHREWKFPEESDVPGETAEKPQEQFLKLTEQIMRKLAESLEQMAQGYRTMLSAGGMLRSELAELERLLADRVTRQAERMDILMQIRSCADLLDRQTSDNAERIGHMEQACTLLEACAARIKKLRKASGDPVLEEAESWITSKEKLLSQALNGLAASRTKLIALYFICYLNRSQTYEVTVWSYRDFLADFAVDLNETLENAGYPILSSKNLFDVLICYNAYWDAR